MKLGEKLGFCCKGAAPLLLAFALALFLRFLFFFLFKTPGYYADSKVYTDIMHFLFDGAQIAKSIHLSWAPGYSIFLKFLSLFVGENLIAVKAVQMLLSAFMVFPLYWLGKTAFGKRAGIAAALLWAVYPYSMMFGEFVMSETFFLLVFVLALVFLVKAIEKPSPLLVLGSGMLLGVLALTRASSKLLFLLVPLFLVFSKKWKPVLALVSIVGALILIGPYVFFLFQTYHQFIFIDNVGEQTLAWTTSPGFSDINPDVNLEASYNETKELANEHPLSLYLQALNPQNLATILSQVPAKLTVFLWLETFMAGQPTRDYYGAVSSSISYNLFAYGSIIFYILLMILFLAGAAYSKSKYAQLFFLVILYFLVIHSLSHAEQRYHLQIMPLVILFAGFTLANAKEIFKKIFDFKLRETKIFYTLLLILLALWAFGFYSFILH
ncbi:MAG: glycosyltransferase family 39 protein [Candidatus Diapherotrites archaeon]